MKNNSIEIDNTRYPLFFFNTIVIGSGVAALNAAVKLHEFGQTSVAIITEEWGGGTSNNAGSDKQTYYRVSLTGANRDSVIDMADDLFAGGCMHGDIALCEASHSVEAFYNLVRLGVPFPHDQYGAFPGYLTDNDPRGRGTSAGPLTSRYMFEALAKEVEDKSIPVFNRCQVVSLITEDDDQGRCVKGAVAMDLDRTELPNFGLTIFCAVNVIFATGGPAGIYEKSAYPKSQRGSTGIALSIGAKAQNLTETQFGIASKGFRWNLSGSFQQVIPCYFSTDAVGGGEREFLSSYFPDLQTLAHATFLKGRQWVFDHAKVNNFGSSLIDLLVFREIEVLKRRVYIDYTKNPRMGNSDTGLTVELLSPEARELLGAENIFQSSPIKRLTRLNPDAVDVFLKNGVDLSTQPVEISVCAQHCNGGLAGNIWWESNIAHLFPIGEVNGSHGVHRPGGSSLNSCQIGGLRAARFIARHYNGMPEQNEYFNNLINNHTRNLSRLINGFQKTPDAKSISIETASVRYKKRMAKNASLVRHKNGIKQASIDAFNQHSDLKINLRVNSVSDIPDAFRTIDHSLTQAFILKAIAEYLHCGGLSRGSYIIPKHDWSIDSFDLETFRNLQFNTSEHDANRKILELWLDEDEILQTRWVEPRPVPELELRFEKVWERFRTDR